MRRSRITYAPFAAGLLAGLIATLWFVFGLTPDSPHVQPFVPDTGMPTTATAPNPDDAIPPHAPARLVIEPEQPLRWQTSYVQTPGLPDERVRLRKPEAIPPDELYSQQRVILRQVRIDAGLEGMQISGEVLTDFYSDRAPEWLPSGPLLGLRIMIELYQHDIVVGRDNHGAPRAPHIDPRWRGSLVPGQSTETVINTPRGQFATASFVLPILSKPLAPGEYSLVASLRFRALAEKLQLAIKWCSDLYGARVEQDAETLELTYRNVMTHSDLHDEVYRYMVETIGVVSDRVNIHVGALVHEHAVKLVGPDAATPTQLANIILEDLHCMLCSQVRDYAHQLDNVEAVVDQALEWKLRWDPKRNADEQDRAKIEKLKEKWRLEAAEEKKRIKRDNAALIQRVGGRMNAEETTMLKRIETARPEVLRQVADFQDRLALNVWILCDGVLQYTGWNSMYLPGYDACEAIQKRRLPGLRPVLDPTAHEQKWQEIVYRWRFVPPGLSDAAFAYLRRKEETNDWHPREFTLRGDKGYRLDTARWNDWREQWQAELDHALADWRTVNTTRTYATQVWPKAMANLKEMYAQTLLLPWTWEHYIRTELQKEPTQEVTTNWPADIAKQATISPGECKQAFDSASTQAKEAAKVGDFIPHYAKAVQAGIKPPG